MRRVDPSGLPSQVFHHTDTQVYVLYLDLILSLNNKQHILVLTTFHTFTRVERVREQYEQRGKRNPLNTVKLVTR